MGARTPDFGSQILNDETKFQIRLCDRGARGSGRNEAPDSMQRSWAVLARHQVRSVCTANFAIYEDGNACLSIAYDDSQFLLLATAVSFFCTRARDGDDDDE